ncbi:hypothetical protein C0J52_05499 [Blattella germanica]|nr:hypothetical protein C0J52_05499 [Blattella germanica]
MKDFKNSWQNVFELTKFYITHVNVLRKGRKEKKKQLINNSLLFLAVRQSTPIPFCYFVKMA